MTGDSAIGPSSPNLTDDFLDRVRRSYRLSAAGDATERDSIWGQISAKQRPIHDALMEDSNGRLRTIFADPGSTDMYYGVDNMAISLRYLPDGTDTFLRDAAGHVVLNRELLVTLGSALALLRWSPPGAEQRFDHGSHGDPSLDIESLLARISDLLGFDVRFPNPFSPELGLTTSRGIVSQRAVQALYQVHRVLQELRGLARRSVLEIGPGMGRAAYYGMMAGISDYTTLDLPLGVVAQACFLGAAIGPEAIWLVGDDPTAAHGRIRLLPSTLPLPDRSFALVVNVDSMPEMDTAALDTYGAWIASHSDALLSINHEANLPTIADIGDRFFASAMSRRFPYWMRTGYVEETFRFTHAGAPDEIARLQATIAALETSTSWRITRPLRAIKNSMTRP
jgi:HAMP domain-containing protein